jgi:hypothetical protein
MFNSSFFVYDLNCRQINTVKVWDLLNELTEIHEGKDIKSVIK